MAIKRKARIGAKHLIRKAVSSLPNYVDNLAEAISLIEGHLSDFGWALDNQFVLNFSGGTEETVSMNIPIKVDIEGGIICSECDKPVELNHCIAFSYYRMQSGRYEITAYVSL